MVDHTHSIGGLGKPKYNGFFQRLGKCHTTQYTTLWHISDEKERKSNSSIFAMYFDEMQEKVAETWRIPPKVAEEHKNISNFQVSRHNMWILGQEGSQEELVVDEVLCDWRGSPMGHERLVLRMEGTNISKKVTKGSNQ
jgi:hypothetical protein